MYSLKLPEGDLVDMNKFLSTIKWDVRFQISNKLYAVGFVLTVMWIGVIILFPAEYMQYVIPIVLLSDLATMGLLFMGAIVYFERGQGFIYSIVTTPLKTSEYLISKVISLSLYVLLVTTAVVASVSFIKNLNANYMYMLLSVLVASAFYTLLGFLLSSFFKTFTDFLFPMGVLFTFFNMPLLWMFDIASLQGFRHIIYIMPSYGLVILLQSILTPKPWYDIVYAVIYNTIAIHALYRLCIKHFNRRIIGRSRDIDA